MPDVLGALQRLGGGFFLEELYEALVATSEEVIATGKPGTVSASFKISQAQQGEPMVAVEEEIARKSPKKDARGAFFYAVEGALHRQDPRQTTFEFRTVDTTTGEIRTLEEPARAVREA